MPSRANFIDKFFNHLDISSSFGQYLSSFGHFIDSGCAEAGANNLKELRPKVDIEGQNFLHLAIVLNLIEKNGILSMLNKF